MKKDKVIGVDIGGVLRRPVGKMEVGSLDRPDNSYLQSPDFLGALNAINQLSSRYMEIHIVSRIPQDLEWKLQRWLEYQGYGEFIPPRKIHFCRERHEKVLICESLGITHFVDDRLEVLDHMAGKVPNLFWFRSTPNRELELLHLVQELEIQTADTWQTMLPLLLRP